MIFNTIANGSSQKKTIPFNQRTNAIDDKSLNLQRHVTFRDSSRNKQQIINPTNKPKYHFTYGQPVNQFTQNKILSQSIYRNVSPQFQTFQIEPRQSLGQNSFIGNSSIRNERNRSESRRKKGLKIFPQKYDENKNKRQQKVIGQQQKEQPKYQKDDVKDQVKQLKNQIEKLKLQIKNLSLNISKNTSRDFTEIQINKNEAQRTRRLSELNQFNQKLYNQLALKLKQISIAEYENYLDQTNSNKQILDQIFESASKSRANQNSDQKELNVNQNFMDIKQFQQQYQQKYNSTGGTENAIHNYDFIPRNLVRHYEQVGSPFLIDENKFQKMNAEQRFDRTNSNMKRKIQKDQVFTFHKQRISHQRHFQKPLYQVQNQLFTLDGQSKNNKPSNKADKKQKQSQIRNSVLEINKIRNVENTNKTQKQLEDFNRELQNKIFKKRVNSQYTTINKQKKY